LGVLLARLQRASRHRSAALIAALFIAPGLT
jgi:hypothetical protein